MKSTSLTEKIQYIIMTHSQWWVIPSQKLLNLACDGCHNRIRKNRCRGPDSLSHLRPYAHETTSYNLTDLAEPYNTSFSFLYPSNPSKFFRASITWSKSERKSLSIKYARYIICPAVADPGFPREWCQPRRGAATYYLANFSHKLHETEEILGQRDRP